jgi:hypothetical protein
MALGLRGELMGANGFTHQNTRMGADTNRGIVTFPCARLRDSWPLTDWLVENRMQAAFSRPRKTSGGGAKSMPVFPIRHLSPVDEFISPKKTPKGGPRHMPAAQWH